MKFKMDKIEIGKWICTDPDAEQYGRYLGGGKYEFRQSKIENKEIDLADFSVREQEEAVSTYYGSLAELKCEYPGDWANWLIAECIFENGLPGVALSEPIFLTFQSGRKVELQEVFCEITGEQLSWATIPPDKPGVTPAYISFRVVNEEGQQVMLVGDLDTF